MLDALSDNELKKTNVTNLRQEYKKLSNIYNRIINEELVYCPHCGNWKAVNCFYSSKNYPDGIEHYACKECLLDMMTDIDKKTKVRTDNKEKTIAVFRKLDWYFNEKDYYEQLNRISEGTGEKIRATAAQQLLVMVQSLKQYQGYSFAESEFLDENGDVIELSSNRKPRREIIKLFGGGFTTEDYLYLQDQYDDWCARTEVDSKSQQTYIIQIAFKQLEIWKAQKANKDTDKLVTSLNNLMNGANLQPRQNIGNASTDTLTFSQLIAKWELDKPVPTPDPELCDVSGIGKKIRVWFGGWLANALGLDVPQSQEYLEEVAKYTVTKPDIEEKEGSSAIYAKMYGSEE